MRNQRPRAGGHLRRPSSTQGAERPRTLSIPPVGDNIRIIPLGGMEEIGKNMLAIECGNDIIIIDAGFQFSEVETPGIDYILPNTAYLEEHKDKIRALFISHGHLDHIGGIPYLIDKLGYPPIYAREFGAIMIKKRQEEFPNLKTLDIRVIDGDETIIVGGLKVKSFEISHAIPDSMGMIVETPYGKLAVIEDVRVDHIDGEPTEKEKEHYRSLAKDEFLLLTLDSTRIEKPGFSMPESKAVETIDQIIKDTKGRMIIGTFASQVDRIVEIIKSAEKHGKKVAVDGRSMKTNVEIIKHLGILKMENIIPIENIDNYPPGKIVILATGAQGEEFAVLMRIANKTHKHIKLNKNDTVLLSSSIIPGNEYSITKLKDNLYRQEARIITYLESDIHSGGHGYRGELEWIHKQINYRFFMPVHGHHYMLRMHAEMARSLGAPEKNIIVPDNGSIVEIQDKGKKIVMLKEKVPSNSLMVDGFSIGGTQEAVIRDRQGLAQDGIFIIFATLNQKTGRLTKSPDIISRGFVYLRESQDLLRASRMIVKKTVEDSTAGMYPINFEYLKNILTDNLSRFLFRETAKRPIVIPVISGV